jgi:hypothetical protein
MSYDVTFSIDTGGNEPHVVADFNITSNLFDIFALAFNDGRGVRSLDTLSGAQAHHVLTDALRRMAADPATYTSLNPGNNWGCSLAGYVFLSQLLATCLEHPLAAISVEC